MAPQLIGILHNPVAHHHDRHHGLLPLGIGAAHRRRVGNVGVP